MGSVLGRLEVGLYLPASHGDTVLAGSSVGSWLTLNTLLVVGAIVTEPTGSNNCLLHGGSNHQRGAQTMR